MYIHYRTTWRTMSDFVENAGLAPATRMGGVLSALIYIQHTYTHVARTRKELTEGSEGVLRDALEVVSATCTAESESDADETARCELTMVNGAWIEGKEGDFQPPPSIRYMPKPGEDPPDSWTLTERTFVCIRAVSVVPRPSLETRST